MNGPPDAPVSASVTRASLREALRQIGVTRGRTIYVTGNLGRLGAVVQDDGRPVREKPRILDMYADTLLESVGPDGTLVFPTHSWGLVRTETIFDPERTATDYALSERLRSRTDCLRQFHPYASVAATGPNARFIIEDRLHRHPYGTRSPFERLVEADALHLSLGLPARLSISAVHHCEMLAGVPYRYAKSFRHPCRIGGEVRVEEFFLHVTYLADGMVRDRNRKLFARETINGALTRAALGRGAVEAVPLALFVREAVSAMIADPYIWLERLPEQRPWEK